MNEVTALDVLTVYGGSVALPPCVGPHTAHQWGNDGFGEPDARGWREARAQCRLCLLCLTALVKLAPAYTPTQATETTP